MRLYTLAEETAATPAFGCEHGLSFYVQTGEEHLLFDLGQSELFLRNAQKLGLDIGRVDRAFLSHGHYDHGGGLAAFLRENNHAPVYVHPQAFEPHFSRKPEGVRPIGLDPDLAHHPRIVPTGDVYEVSPNLLLFADVTGCDCLSEGGKNLLERVGDDYVPDAFAHEQSLIVYEAGKCILFTGCAHRALSTSCSARPSMPGVCPMWWSAGCTSTAQARKRASRMRSSAQSVIGWKRPARAI